jgi:hypothetical protein
MTRTVLFAFIGLTCLPLAAAAQETPKVDANSMLVVVRGCPKGRALVPLAVEGEAATPATLIGRPMRLNGKRDLMKLIEGEKGHLVEVTGLIRKSDLRASGPSRTFGGMRVTAGAASPMSSDPSRQAAFDVIVIDVTSFRPLSNECPSGRR